jgi:hypothetical protein
MFLLESVMVTQICFAASRILDPLHYMADLENSALVVVAY